MTLRNRLAFAACVLAFSVSSVASPGSHAEIGQPAAAASATRTVNIEMTDLAFSPKTLEVKAGETVRFVLVNKGQLLHEFNLGDAAMHAEHQKEMLKMQQSGAMTTTGMDHAGMDHGAMGQGSMPMAGMTHDDPNSVLVEPGKTAELTWTFSGTRDLEFACNVPGHYQAGMVGTLKVAP
ncbi:copper-binding protein [Pseudomonas lundensis]|uniref:copper-resistant cuproprotein CopI n=1 Tax=Pseudomonas lundensis TaxID=86185 RepID=UPI000641D35C|nr:cupredoxin family protein [Pseudomonas lundensis]AOZ11710.1 copper-binding protein [Pseudomonas lundensis]QVQ77218.1 cupredoxin domain-containing protein [Pseudomonas lundensis]QVQ79799.1 cupredoxin domain-containing protein [Pseudomonas lundensis]